MGENEAKLSNELKEWGFIMLNHYAVGFTKFVTKTRHLVASE